MCKFIGEMPYKCSILSKIYRCVTSGIKISHLNKHNTKEKKTNALSVHSHLL